MERIGNVNIAIPAGYVIGERNENAISLYPDDKSYELKIDLLEDETDAKVFVYRWKRDANVAKETFRCGAGWRAVYGTMQRCSCLIGFNAKSGGVLCVDLIAPYPTMAFAAYREARFTELVNGIVL